MSPKLICFFLCALMAPDLTGEDALLPTPQNISILSTNMKHFLTWSPVIVQGETVRYSVSFRGGFWYLLSSDLYHTMGLEFCLPRDDQVKEYEREYANESWIPICECSLLATTACDITEDISATVAYSLRVRAHLGAGRSEWGTLKGFFNRITTSLTPPLMKVIADGYHLLVELEDMGPAFQFCILYWKKGQESRVQQKVVQEVRSVVHLATMEAGPDYCLKAQTYVEAINRSSSFSPTQCVRAPGGTSTWLVTALISCAGFAVAALTLPFLTWKTRKIFQYSCCPAIVLPDTLIMVQEKSNSFALRAHGSVVPLEQAAATSPSLQSMSARCQSSSCPSSLATGAFDNHFCSHTMRPTSQRKTRQVTAVKSNKY